jgi:hypothetical protein
MRSSTTLVRLLVWVYQAQLAHLETDRGHFEPEAATMRGYELVGESGDGVAQMMRIGLFGCRIDSGLRGNGGLGGGVWSVSDDADLVHSHVEAIWVNNREGAGLLRQYARTGSTPTWFDGRQEYVPILNEKGRPRVECIEVVKVRNHGEAQVLYCPVELYPATSYIEMCRAIYTSWLQALETLQMRLKGVAMKDWEITAIGAVAEPWRIKHG